MGFRTWRKLVVTLVNRETELVALSREAIEAGLNPTADR
jgi:hypothetical protein